MKSGESDHGRQKRKREMTEIMDIEGKKDMEKRNEVREDKKRGRRVIMEDERKREMAE